MLFGETVAVYCEYHTEHTDTLCGQNAGFSYLKASGTYSYHWACGQQVAVCRTEFWDYCFHGSATSRTGQKKPREARAWQCNVPYGGASWVAAHWGLVPQGWGLLTCCILGGIRHFNFNMTPLEGGDTPLAALFIASLCHEHKTLHWIM
jgi:hypothetical protein